MTYFSILLTAERDCCLEWRHSRIVKMREQGLPVVTAALCASSTSMFSAASQVLSALRTSPWLSAICMAQNSSKSGSLYSLHIIIYVCAMC
jgi:hypothetical protein